jgi:hypothetical protein
VLYPLSYGRAKVCKILVYRDVRFFLPHGVVMAPTSGGLIVSVLRGRGVC